MSESESRTAAVELSALKIVLRALARSHMRLLEGGGADLLDGLKAEASNLAITTVDTENRRADVLSALNGWIEAVKAEAAALGDLETRDATGRPIHFVD